MKIKFQPFKFEKQDKEIPDGYHTSTIIYHKLTSHYYPSFDTKQEAMEYIVYNADEWETWTILETYSIEG
jgi:hypothetical protein